MIGLCNILVHDYVNMDPDIIPSVIDQDYSYKLFVFAEQWLHWLNQKDSCIDS
ncbi:HepT-like ribonuclease domain-containing protein [Shewanella sp.]|uniref:HepT-like ribonuclease domain-containing protein n=1 Tax=Shewanella TaxID=22 RepID=UPI00257D7DE3|nr:HepT-like ribonuclease domain-containing protein [Shewanella sp.]